MNTAVMQEVETVSKRPGWVPCPEVPASVRHHSSARANIGLWRRSSLIAAAAIILAAPAHPAVAAGQAYREPKVPDFSMMANDGQTYTPDYLKGNVVLLVFWATWCPYCKKAIPHMNDFAREYANAPVTILGICGSKDRNTWRDYIQQHQMQWPQYFDSNLRMASLFQADGVPNFFLIDKDGYIVDHWVGWDDSLTDQVEKLIDHTLARPRRQ